MVHLHGAFNESNTSVARSLRCPYVFSPHSGYDPVSLRRSRGRKLVYGVLFERTMLRRAALLVALTNVELADIRRFGGTGPSDVIPNGVERPPDDLDRQAFRRELGIPPDALLAVFVGRLDVQRKGLDTLVRGDRRGAGLAPRARRTRGSETSSAWKRMTSDLGASERVHLVGERHGRSLFETVSAADLFTLLSRWEGLPMALLEALALATPALVSPAVERLIGVGRAGAGWVADDDDVGPLLRGLTKDDELAQRGRAALELLRALRLGLGRRALRGRVPGRAGIRLGAATSIARRSMPPYPSEHPYWMGSPHRTGCLRGRRRSRRQREVDARPKLGRGLAAGLHRGRAYPLAARIASQGGQPRGAGSWRPDATACQTAARAAPLLALLMYDWVDFFLGTWLRILPIKARGGLVVMERGWGDMAVDPRRYHLDVPSRIVEVLGRLLPGPDVALILYADPQLLRDRKAELPTPELARQLLRWRQISFPRRTRRSFLDASLKPERLVDQAMDALRVS